MLLRFSINLCRGDEIGNGDTLYQFNPRFDQSNEIVRNAHLDGSWGSEERDGGDIEVRPGDDVEIKISVKNDFLRVRLSSF